MHLGAGYNVLVLGGGCAGLTLSVELVRQGYPGRILVVEPREAYRRDRTWCYWNLLPHAFQDCVTQRWEQWSVRWGQREARQVGSSYAYEQIPAERFYAAALRRLAAAPNVTVQLGTAALGFRRSSGAFEVETSRGSVRASTLFDARPPGPGDTRPLLVQHFLGWHLRTENPVFETGCATLMDFTSEPGRDINFFYVLPYSSREALVETTFLSPRPFDDVSRYESSLRRYLADRLGVRGCDIIYRERGAIPMGRPAGVPIPAVPGYFPVGTRGGLVRPSTGYAFLAIQRWSRAFAKSFVESERETISPPPYSRLSGWLDHAFLQHLLDAPELAPETFLAMFSSVGADATVRFLSDQAGLGDHLRVISAMPKVPLIRAAARAGLTGCGDWGARARSHRRVSSGATEESI